jgi:hypothetical protein
LSDRLILVNAIELFNHADPVDLKCRNSGVIQDSYHADWFFEFNGRNYFEPPPVNIEDGIIKFIDDRHRSILLSRHLDAVPLLIGNLDKDHRGGTATEKSIEALSKITVKQFPEHSVFNNMPELGFSDFEQA